jgi:hypothetical protein
MGWLYLMRNRQEFAGISNPRTRNQSTWTLSAIASLRSEYKPGSEFRKMLS